MPRRHHDPDRGRVLARFTVTAPYLHEDDLPADRVVRRGSPLAARRVVETIALHLKRENRYDFPLYAADAVDPTSRAYLLIDDSVALSTGSLVLGAVHVSRGDDDVWWADWAWVHPYRRGHGLVDAVWPTIRTRHPGVLFAPPYTKAGRAMARRLDALPSAGRIAPT